MTTLPGVARLRTVAASRTRRHDLKIMVSILCNNMIDAHIAENGTDLVVWCNWLDRPVLLVEPSIHAVFEFIRTQNER